MQQSAISCPFRAQVCWEGTTEVAQCGLLREITGATDPGLCRVARDACVFCSKSAEPGVHQINPVIGSLLFGMTTEIIGRGGVAGCDVDKADRVRRWSEEFLDSEPGEVDESLLPERVRADCHYLGDAVGARVPESDGGRSRVAAFRCHHPAHVETTRDECIRCREWSARPRPDADPIERWLPVPAVRTGGLVRRWAVGVTTAPRRRPTLEWTLDSLARAGWGEARLFVDGAVSIPHRHAHYPVTSRVPRSGAWPNFYLALAELLMRDPDADAYLMVQDDVMFYDRTNLREYVESILWPGDPPPPISLYSCQLDEAAEFGWHPHDAAWFRGALAFIFHPATVRQILVDPIVFGHRWNAGKDGLLRVDTVVGAWAHRNGVPVLFPTPSLCRHIGQTSTLWPELKVDHDRKEGSFGDEVRGHVRGATSQAPSLGAFPEAAFPCPEAVAEEYRRTVERGLSRMRTRSVTICGIGRDVARTFPAFVARVERLGAKFRAYHAVFYENDSTDETPGLLKAWAGTNPAIHVISERRGDPRFGSVRSLVRAAALASYRNRCREKLLADFAADDNVIVVDMDLEGGWSEEGIAHTFGHDDWDFVGSFGLRPGTDHRNPWQKPVHCDIWAYRIPGHEEPRPTPQVQALPLRRGDPLQPVWSCFGGLGVYRMECFQAASYSGDDCEHAAFHRTLRRRGFDRLYLNPSQIVIYETPDSPHLPGQTGP